MLFDLTKSELINLEFSLTIYACLSILQYTTKDSSDEALRKILQYLREIHSDQNISDYASRFLTYLFEVKDIEPKDITSFVPELREVAMTTAELLRKEGREEVARNMLKRNEPISKIQEYTGLSESEIQMLKG